MLEALKKRYEAQVAESIATINIYLKSPVGIGEHPQHLDEVDKLLQVFSYMDLLLDRTLYKIYH